MLTGVFLFLSGKLDVSDNLWDRQRNSNGELEPILWYSRFEDYRLMGPDRSLLGAVNLERVKKGQKKSNYIPGSWRGAAAKWNWKKRAEAWDASEIERRQEEDKQDRIEERKCRRDLLRDYRGKIAQAIQALAPDDARWGDVARAVETLTQESRAEYDDLPAQRLEHSGPGGGPILGPGMPVIVYELNDSEYRNQENIPAETEEVS